MSIRNAIIRGGTGDVCAYHDRLEVVENAQVLLDGQVLGEAQGVLDGDGYDVEAVSSNLRVNAAGYIERISTGTNNNDIFTIKSKTEISRVPGVGLYFKGQTQREANSTVGFYCRVYQDVVGLPDVSDRIADVQANGNTGDLTFITWEYAGGPATGTTIPLGLARLQGVEILLVCGLTGGWFCYYKLAGETSWTLGHVDESSQVPVMRYGHDWRGTPNLIKMAVPATDYTEQIAASVIGGVGSSGYMFPCIDPE
jgi:hypothetical protein